MSSNAWFISRQWMKLPGETTLFLRSRGRLCSHTTASRSASGTAARWISSVLTTLKIAVLAPMPIASAAIAMAENPGARASRRSAVAEILQQRHHDESSRFELLGRQPEPGAGLAPLLSSRTAAV